MREVVHFQDSPFANYIEDEGFETDVTELMTLSQQKEQVEESNPPKTLKPKRYTFNKLLSFLADFQGCYFDKFFVDGVSVEHLKTVHLRSKGNIRNSGIIIFGVFLLLRYFGSNYLCTILCWLLPALFLLVLGSQRKEIGNLYQAFLLNVYHGDSIIESLGFLESLRNRNSQIVKETKKTIYFLRELESSSMFFRLAGSYDPSSMEYRILEEKILAKRLRISLVQKLMEYLQLLIDALNCLNSKEVEIYKEQLDLYKNSKLKEIETTKISLGVLNDFLYLAQAIELDFFDALKFKFSYKRPNYREMLELVAMQKKLVKESENLGEAIQNELKATKSSELLNLGAMDSQCKDAKQKDRTDPKQNRSEKALKTLRAFISTVKEDHKKFKRHLDFLYRIIDSGIYSSEEKCEQVLQTIAFVENFYKELMASNLQTFGSLTKIFSEIDESKKGSSSSQQHQISSNTQDEMGENQMGGEIGNSDYSEHQEESHPTKDMILEAEANPDEIEKPRVNVQADSTKRKIEEMNAVMGELQGAFLRKNLTEDTIINKKIDKHGKSSIEIIKKPQPTSVVNHSTVKQEKPEKSDDKASLAQEETNYTISPGRPNLFALDFKNQFMSEIKSKSLKMHKEEKTFE